MQRENPAKTFGADKAYKAVTRRKIPLVLEMRLKASIEVCPVIYTKKPSLGNPPDTVLLFMVNSPVFSGQVGWGVTSAAYKPDREGWASKPLADRRWPGCAQVQSGQRRVREAARRRGGGESAAGGERLPARRPGRTPARRLAGEARRADKGAELCLRRSGQGGAWRGGAPVIGSNPRGGAARNPARHCSAPAGKSPRHRDKTESHFFLTKRPFEFSLPEQRSNSLPTQ